MTKTRFLVTPCLMIALLAVACAKEECTTEVVTIDAFPIQAASAPADSPADTISFWSTESNPERIDTTQQLIDAFTAQTGIGVIRVYVSEDALPETMEAAAEEGNLPEVVFHPVDFTVGWAMEGLLDADAADAVVESLGRDTFAEGALDLATVDGMVAAVPSDGWGQLLIYRRDLFEAAGLGTPDTFENIEAAAAALSNPADGFYGITAASDGGAVFTQQTFEHLALANGCNLADATGAVTLDSAECVEAIDFYARLLAEYGPEGPQDVDSTREMYFAGDAAMIIWSPFILDEMAGLRDDALPQCPECTDDPAYLAGNSGIIPSFSGPSGAAAQYGQISYMGIGAGTQTEAAQLFLEFWFNEGYLDWLSTSVEGKFPMRRGVPGNPNFFVEEWKQLETGVDRKARLSDLYDAETINTLIAGSSDFARWGFAQGQGQLVTAIYSSLPVPAALEDVLEGRLTAEEAAAEMQEAVEDELAWLDR